MEKQILIKYPEGQTDLISLKDNQPLTIGREPDNNLALNDSTVSRYHTKIEYDGAVCRVTDLNSRNGTFLSDIRLAPGVPTIWMPTGSLRIGSTHLSLEQTHPITPQPAITTTPQLRPKTDTAPHRPVIETVKVSLINNHLAVTPGQTASTRLIISNLGVASNRFTVSIRGIPADWFLKPAPITLSPNQEQTVKLTFDIPKSPASKPGQYNFIIRVAGQINSTQTTEISGILTVNAYVQFSSQLHSQQIKANQPAQISIHNQGNVPETFTVRTLDDTNDLTIDPQRVQLTIAEGQIATTNFSAAPKQIRWFGNKKKHPFTTHISSANGQIQTHEAVLFSQGLAPTWFGGLLGILLLVSGVLFGLIITKPPVIRSLSVEPVNPAPGDLVTIRWQIDQAEQVDLLPLVNDLNPDQGEYVFVQPPSGLTELTLIATNRFRRIERPLRIGQASMEPIRTPEPGAPVLEEWLVFPTEIIQGQPVTIRWRVRNADQVTLQPFGTVDRGGEMTDRPQQTKTYRLVATGQGQTIERSQEVLVKPPAPNAPQVKVFTVEPGFVISGQASIVRLTWDTHQANSVMIEPNIGLVGLTGFLDLPAPTVDTVYTLIARNEGGETRIQVLVRVIVPTPTVTPSGTPTAIPPTSSPVAPTPTWTPEPTPEIMPTDTVTATPVLEIGTPTPTQ